jgi:ankyrin repeat protein
MMDERVPPTYQDRDSGKDCLHWAVVHNNLPLVRLIIERGGSANYHEAKQLESQHSDVDELTKKILTNSALQIASYNGFVNIVWLLMADGFSAEDKDSLGNTSVHLSASAGHAAVLRVLLQCGAQINVFNKFKNLPVDVAITKETAELLHNEIEKRQGSYDPVSVRADTIRMVRFDFIFLICSCLFSNLFAS